jgi:predicted nucleic acid-binding protein
MILIDTNVISDLMAPEPSANVTEWFRAIAPASVFTSTVTQAEILYGVRILPEGKRKTELEVKAGIIFGSRLSGRVLPFDVPAAKIYAETLARRRAMGRPMTQFDAQIAAIALSRGASLATRNVADFTNIDLEVINPWDYRG